MGKKKYEACLTYYNDPAKISYGIILTHGAGGDMNHKQLVGIAEKLAKAGYLVLRFTCKGLNLAYRTKVYTGIVVKKTFFLNYNLTFNMFKSLYFLMNFKVEISL